MDSRHPYCESKLGYGQLHGVNRIEVNPEESYGLELVEIKRGDTMGTELGGRQFSLVRATALNDS